MRITFEKTAAEDEDPTVFPVVSCPANMIVLQTVSAGTSGRSRGNNAHRTCEIISPSVNLHSGR